MLLDLMKVASELSISSNKITHILFDSLGSGLITRGSLGRGEDRSRIRGGRLLGHISINSSRRCFGSSTGSRARTSGPGIRRRREKPRH